MAKLSKRMRAIADKIDADKAYDIDEAVALLNELAGTKFKRVQPAVALIDGWSGSQKCQVRT